MRLSCYKSKSLCAHSIAIAEKMGKLDKFLQWYKTSGKDVNLWAHFQDPLVCHKIQEGNQIKPLAQVKKGKEKLSTISKSQLLSRSYSLPFSSNVNTNYYSQSNSATPPMSWTPPSVQWSGHTSFLTHIHHQCIHMEYSIHQIQDK